MKRFEVFFRCVVDNAPSLLILRSQAIKKWGSEIGSVNPSFIPRKGDELVIFQQPAGEKNLVNSHEFCDFMVKNDLFFPNFLGLIVLEKMILDKKIILPKEEDKWYIGYDHLRNLHLKHNYGYMVPYLRKNGEYSYGWHPYNSLIEHNERIVTFEKKS